MESKNERQESRETHRDANTFVRQSEEYLAEPAIHEQWDSAYLNSDLEPFYEAAFDRLASELGAFPGASILDAGCGYGYHSIRLARRGFQVTGVDFSTSALRIAHARVNEEFLANQISLTLGNLTGLPFADSSFDYVNCWGVLMHIPELERALSELARVLKPGGRIAICENSMKSIHVRYWEPSLRMLKRALGRDVPARRTTDRGIEEWNEAETGGLLVRKTDLDWLINYYENLGMCLESCFATQFTELYANLPTRALRRAVYSFNWFWFRRVRDSRRSLGNVLIFSKS